MNARKLDHGVGRRQCERTVRMVKDERISLERELDNRVRRRVQRLTDTSRNTRYGQADPPKSPKLANVCTLSALNVSVSLFPPPCTLLIIAHWAPVFRLAKPAPFGQSLNVVMATSSYIIGIDNIRAGAKVDRIRIV